MQEGLCPVDSMATPAVSKLWSCQSLKEGIDHVAGQSATPDKDELLKELQDSVTVVGSHALLGFWLAVNTLQTSGHLFSVRRSLNSVYRRMPSEPRELSQPR